MKYARALAFAAVAGITIVTATDFKAFMQGKQDLEVLFAPTATSSLDNVTPTKSAILVTTLDKVKNRLTELRHVDGIFGDTLVAGPLALDLAVSPTSARLKGVDNPVAGHADMLLAPDIESGNILHKAISMLLGAPIASVVVGSKAPVVVPSRGDSERSKLASIALAVYLAQQGGAA